MVDVQPILKCEDTAP